MAGLRLDKAAPPYYNAIAPHLESYPEPIREAASRSLGESMSVAERLGEQGVVEGPTLSHLLGEE